jgi:hypothetical protein
VVEHQCVPSPRPALRPLTFRRRPQEANRLSALRPWVCRLLIPEATTLPRGAHPVERGATDPSPCSPPSSLAWFLSRSAPFPVPLLSLSFRGSVRSQSPNNAHTGDLWIAQYTTPRERRVAAQRAARLVAAVASGSVRESLGVAQVADVHVTELALDACAAARSARGVES